MTSTAETATSGGTTTPVQPCTKDPASERVKSAQLTMTDVPPNWMHPDLRRQLTERSRNRAEGGLERIKHYRIATEACAQTVERRLIGKRERMERLEEELAEVRREVDSLEKRSGVLKEILVGVGNQSYYQRSLVEEAIARQRHGTSTGNVSPPPPMAMAKAALPDISSSIGTIDGYTNFTPTCSGPVPADLFCPVDVHFLHNADFCLAAPSRTPSSEDVEDIKAFLRRFAPLFTWNSELGCVPPPLLFDEPCLMEPEETSLPCTSPGCAYWHRDELAHLQRALEHVADCADAVCTFDAQLCGVRTLFSSLRSFVRNSAAIDQLCCGVAYTLNRVIALRWHTHLLRPHQVASGSQSPAPSAAAGWAAPVAAAAAAAADPLTGLPPDRLACEEERDAWEVAVTAVQHGSTPADIFTADATALSWRCMARLLGTDRERRRWLAEKGCSLFPTSPHLQAARLFAMMEGGSGVATLDCTTACLEATRLLSAQAAAATFTQPETTYGSVAARYVAFMIAACAVHIAREAPSAAEKLLTDVLGACAGGESESSGGGYALLPVAQQNLTLLLIALQRTGTLQGAELLPLASISDTPLVLSSDFPSDPQEVTVARLNAQLTLLNACQRDGMEPALLDRLKSATQLSLVRAFSQSIQFVEQIVRKAASHSEETQAALWLAYARCLCFVDGFPAAPRVTTELLQESAGEASCLLTLLLLWHLQSHQPTASTMATSVAEKAVDGFAARHHLPTEGELSNRSLGDVPLGVSRVEWVAYHVLKIQLDSPEAEAQHESLKRFPLSAAFVSSEDTDPVLLLLMAELRVAAALGGTAHFQDSITRSLALLAAAHRQWWSALDAWAEVHAVGLPHWVVLTVYRAIPFILGERSAELTLPWRTIVLEVASGLHVLHPVLQDSHTEEAAPELERV